MNKNVFHKLSYGVYVVSTWDDGRPTGCTANSAMQITSSPATIAVSINHDNYTNYCINETGRFAVSILAEDSDPSIIGTFGFKSGKDADKFKEVKYSVEDHMPVISDSCGYVVCEVIDRMETATHTVFLGEVKGAELFEDKDAMTYAYYHKVVKGKSPKNAPIIFPRRRNLRKREKDADLNVKYVDTFTKVRSFLPIINVLSAVWGQISLRKYKKQ